jgi:hypothetical protein
MGMARSSENVVAAIAAPRKSVSVFSKVVSLCSVSGSCGEFRHQKNLSRGRHRCPLTAAPPPRRPRRSSAGAFVWRRGDRGAPVLSTRLRPSAIFICLDHDSHIASATAATVHAAVQATASASQIAAVLRCGSSGSSSAGVGSSGRASPSGGTCTCFISRSPRVREHASAAFHSIARAQSRGFEPRWPSARSSIWSAPASSS